MELLNALLQSMETVEAQLEAAEWECVQEQLQQVEQSAEKMSKTINPENLSPEEQDVFNSVRETHARILLKAEKRQDEIRSEMNTFLKGEKAHQAYGAKSK